MLGSPQVSRTPSILIECTSFQRLCMGLGKRHGLGMLGLIRFCYVSVGKTLFTLKHDTDPLTLLCPDFRK
jgi:hypothetical protein